MKAFVSVLLIALVLLVPFSNEAPAPSANPVTLEVEPAVVVAGKTLGVTCKAVLVASQTVTLELQTHHSRDFTVILSNTDISEAKANVPTIKESYRSNVKVEGSLTPPSNAYLRATFPNVTCMDSNQWRCRLTQYGAPLTEELDAEDKFPLVQIHELPRGLMMHVLPWQQWYQVGQTVALRCSAENTAALGEYFRWTWRRAGQTSGEPYPRTADIEDSTDRRYTSTQGCDVRSGASTLWYTFTQASDVEFSCSVFNSSISRTFRVQDGAASHPFG